MSFVRYSLSFVAVLVLVSSSPAFAQTSWGVAALANGDLVFCDLRREQVVRYSTDAGLSVVLPGTHCRALALAPDGNVYGESVGGTTVDAATGTPRGDVVGVWRIGMSGQATWLQVPVPSPDPSLWIVIDRQGRSHGWNGALPRTTLSQIVRRDIAGSAPVAGGAWGQRDGFGTAAQFGRVLGMAIAPDHSLIVADSGNIRRMTPEGYVSTESLGTVTDAGDGVAARLGLWDRPIGVAADIDGAAIVVDLPARRIVRIERNGQAQEIWRSHWGRRPTGVAMTAGGYYVLEDWPMPSFIADLVGSPRVLFVNRDGSSRTIVTVSNWTVRGLAVLTVVIVFSALRSRRGRTRLPQSPHGGLQ
jgi:hypothetical protein